MWAYQGHGPHWMGFIGLVSEGWSHLESCWWWTTDKLGETVFFNYDQDQPKQLLCTLLPFISIKCCLKAICCTKLYQIYITDLSFSTNPWEILVRFLNNVFGIRWQSKKELSSWLSDLNYKRSWLSSGLKKGNGNRNCIKKVSTAYPSMCIDNEIRSFELTEKKR